MGLEELKVELSLLLYSERNELRWFWDLISISILKWTWGRTHTHPGETLPLNRSFVSAVLGSFSVGGFWNILWSERSVRLVPSLAPRLCLHRLQQQNFTEMAEGATTLKGLRAQLGEKLSWQPWPCCCCCFCGGGCCCCWPTWGSSNVVTNWLMLAGKDAASRASSVSSGDLLTMDGSHFPS